MTVKVYVPHEGLNFPMCCPVAALATGEPNSPRSGWPGLQRHLKLNPLVIHVLYINKPSLHVKISNGNVIFHRPGVGRGLGDDRSGPIARCPSATRDRSERAVHAGDPTVGNEQGLHTGNVDSLMKLIAALDDAGIQLIAQGAASAEGGCGVRFTGLKKGNPVEPAGERVLTGSRAA